MAKRKTREQKKREKQRRKPRLVVEDMGDGALWGSAEPDGDRPELMTNTGDELTEKRTVRTGMEHPLCSRLSPGASSYSTRFESIGITLDRQCRVA